jgi:hypothetical protein
MYNDPSREVVVFVFLLSASGNSMAIWRRRIALPPDALQQHGHQLAVTKMDLHPAALQVETYVVGAFSDCPMMITGFDRSTSEAAATPVSDAAPLPPAKPSKLGKKRRDKSMPKKKHWWQIWKKKPKT